MPTTTWGASHCGGTADDLLHSRRSRHRLVASHVENLAARVPGACSCGNCFELGRRKRLTEGDARRRIAESKSARHCSSCSYRHALRLNELHRITCRRCQQVRFGRRTIRGRNRFSGRLFWIRSHEAFEHRVDLSLRSSFALLSDRQFSSRSVKRLPNGSHHAEVTVT